MKNVTVTLDERVARWARVRAAEQDLSLSRFLGLVLERQMRQESNYEAAMQRYLGRGPQPMKSEGELYPRREELYEHNEQPGQHGLR